MRWIAAGTYWRCDMLLETTLACIVIAAVFGGYAGILGWGLWYTRRA